MSMIRIDEKLVPFDSLSKEEKSAVWDVMAKRIGETITEYVNRHPDQYDAVVAALEWANEHAW